MNYTLTTTGDIAGPFEAGYLTGVNITTTVDVEFQRSLDFGATWVTIETLGTTSKNVIGPGHFRVRLPSTGTATVQIKK